MPYIINISDEQGFLARGLRGVLGHLCDCASLFTQSREWPTNFALRFSAGAN